MAHPLVHPEEWLILPEEERLLTNRTPHGRLGFAVLLKFFQVKGRFPNRQGEVGKDIVVSIAEQIGVPIESWHDLDWEGRTIKRHRADIREWCGFREVTLSDLENFRRWLVEEIIPQGYPIVAIAIKGVTIDKDSGTAVQNSYVLSMPASATSGTVSSNFISPMSSQLREMMETGKYATMQQAMNDLGAKIGMPAGTDMLTDYMAANNATMHTAAQNMASLMGSQMPQVMGTSGSTTAVDVNRYRAMMGMIFSNMSSIKGSTTDAQSAMSDLMGTMTTSLSNMPMMSVGQPFLNMSTTFRGGMMGGATGGMMR